MNLFTHPLTLVTFLPLLGAVVILFLKAGQKNAARWTALVTSLVTLGVSIAAYSVVDRFGVQTGPTWLYGWTLFALGGTMLGDVMVDAPVTCNGGEGYIQLTRPSGFQTWPSRSCSMKRPTRVPASTMVRIKSASNMIAKWYQKPRIARPPGPLAKMWAIPSANEGAPPVR